MQVRNLFKPLLGALFALCLVGHASAGVPLMTLMGTGTGGSTTPPPAYSGPGDVNSGTIKWWGGLRAYSQAKATALAAAVNICLPSAGACTDIHLTSTGGLNSADITTAGCASINTCTVKTVYDQSGGGHDMTQATEGTRCTFWPNGLATGKPAIKCLAGASQIATATGFSNLTSGPYTFAMVLSTLATPGGNGRMIETATGPELNYNSGDHYGMYFGNAVVSQTITATHGTFYAIIGGTDNAGNGTHSQDGTLVTGNAGNDQTGTSISIPGPSGPGTDLFWSEGGWWSTKLSSGDFTALNSNMQTYWGI